MRKRNKTDGLYKLSAVEIYEMVLRRDLKRFPMNFWKEQESMKDAIEVTKYLVEKILKWSDKDIKERWGADTLKDNKLWAIATCLFGGSSYKVINAAYPNKFKPWEFKFPVQNYWNMERGIEATKWLIEEKLKWSDKEIKENLISKIFSENGLRGMVHLVFGASTYRAINSAYPNKFKPWELVSTPQGYWNMETSIEATKWLIEEKLKWSDEKIKKEISVIVFNENNLGGMMQQVFDTSPYNCINAAYPNRFMPWEFHICLKNYWDIETGIKAIKWLIEEKLKILPLNAISQISSKIIMEYKLEIPYYTVFKGSLKNAIKAAYPELEIIEEEKIIDTLCPISKRIEKEELCKLSAVEIYKLFLNGNLSKFPTNFWRNTESKKRAMEIVKYLVEEFLKWSDKDIKEKFCGDILKKNGLREMAMILFNNSFYMAINLVYPNKFKPWEFKLLPLDYWNIETAIEATKWLIEEKLKWSDEDIKEKIYLLVFSKNYLGRMLKHVFNGSIYACINSTYPNRFMPWELPKCSSHYWNMETSIKAMKWLIEEKLKISPEDAISKVGWTVVDKYKLTIPYYEIFEGSSKKIIAAVYPEFKIVYLN